MGLLAVSSVLDEISKKTRMYVDCRAKFMLRLGKYIGVG